MKTKLFLFLTCCIATLSKAQISLRPYVGTSVQHYGFSADSKYDEWYGLGNAQDRKEVQNMYGYRFGLNVGMGVDFSINEEFSIETGLRYSQKGATYNYNVVEIDFLEAKYEVNGDERFDYLELPLNVNYTLDFDPVKWTIFAGPSLAYLVNIRFNYNLKETVDGVITTEKFDSNNDSNWKKGIMNDLMPLDFGLNLGTRLEYENFTFMINYQRGLLNLEKWDSNPMRHEGFMASLGYKINVTE
jgi:hypothetical protein